MAKQTIVVVDDEAPARSAVARLLRERGFTVHALSSGQEAIDMAMKVPYDVLLTDFRMPDGLDGLTTVRAIRRLLPQIVAIMMTGHNSVDLAIQSLNLGVHGFVVKPFTAYELTRTIEQAITKEQLVRENIKMRALVDVFNTTQALISADTQPEKLPNLTVELAVKEVQADYSFLFLAPRELPDDNELDLLAVARREVDEAPDSTPLIYTLEVGSYERDNPGALEILCDKAKAAIAEMTTLFYIDGEQINFSDGQNANIVPSQEKACEIAVPLMVQGRKIGALVVVREGLDRSFSEVDLQNAGILGAQAAIAIDNAKLFRRLAKVEGEREADKLRSQFLANISHELRTPLTYIKGYATTLLRPDVQWGSQTGIEYLNIINDECDKLLQLIVNTLEISKMESGVLRITPEPTNILEVVERIASEVSRRSKVDIQVVVSSQGDIPFVLADPQRIIQVLRNLLENALKYTVTNPQITIQIYPLQTAEASKEMLKIAVHDNGIGLAQSEKAKLFERFYRVNSSITQQVQGSGLGLAICRGIVEAHGGSIWAESSGLEQGSSFFFTLPVADMSYVAELE